MGKTFKRLKRAARNIGTTYISYARKSIDKDRKKRRKSKYDLARKTLGPNTKRHQAYLKSIDR